MLIFIKYFKYISSEKVTTYPFKLKNILTKVVINVNLKCSFIIREYIFNVLGLCSIITLYKMQN